MKNSAQMKIKEVIVVEGKDDTRQLRRAVEADTLETRGSALSKETLRQIEMLNARRGVIVFTDPDYSGERIRKTIAHEVPGVKHAFLERRDAAPHGPGSLGVEHASPEAIRAALRNVHTEAPAAPTVISREMLLDAGLIGGKTARKRRERLGNLLGIGYVNGKHLLERLRLFRVTREAFDQAIKQLDEEDQ